MKKIVTIALMLILAQTAVMAQKAKSVNERDVPERYVRDFQNKGINAKDLHWTMVDSLVYDATYVDENGTTVAYRFSPKGTETRWFVEEKYYPHAIKDTVAQNYPKHKITELYVLSIKNKMTYQVRIAKKGGLFCRKEKDVKLLNFETDGKLIDVIDY
ncbi:MAG: hypothetical protein II532_03045 [Bacteroidales bacterium]|nr:hypothetical protein [Bacteroidales bacterium]